MFLEDVQKLVRDVSDGNVMQLKEKLMRYHQRGCLLEKPAKIKKDGALMAALNCVVRICSASHRGASNFRPTVCGYKNKHLSKATSRNRCSGEVVRWKFHRNCAIYANSQDNRQA
eukprot:UN06397